MSRPVLLSSSSLRLDQRRPLEVRPIALTFASTSAASLDGCATCEQGLTKVQVGVMGPKEPPRGGGASKNEKATIDVEVSWASFANASEKKRRGRGDRRLLEMANSIRNTFEPVIMTSQYPRSHIAIFVHVLNADGGVLSAAINACTLALMHAGVAMSSPVASISVACLHDVPLLDPSSPEEDLPNLCVACLSPDPATRAARINLVNLETRLSLERFEAMVRLAAEACDVIRAELNAATRIWAEGLASQASRLKGSEATVAIDDMEA